MNGPNEVDRAIAESALEALIKKLGMAFHPEVDISSYVETMEGGHTDASIAQAFKTKGFDFPDLTGEPSFTQIEVQHYQHCLDLAWEVFGEGIYDEIKKHEPWKSYFEEQERGQ